MSALLQDLRYGWRTLVKSPGFTAVAVLTLALGIGANSAIWSVVDAVLLRPLPFSDPDRLAMAWVDNTHQGIRTDITSYPGFLDWRQQNDSFTDLAAFRPRRVNLTGEGEPERIAATAVTGSFFPVLGTGPVLGRGFVAAEEEEGRDRSVILADGLWRRRFGADRGVLGRTLRLNGEERTIVGVMPPGFDFPEKTAVWLPLAPSAQMRASRGRFWLYTIGRLKPGATLAGAQASLAAISERGVRILPELAGYGAFVQPLRDHLVGEVRTGLFVLLGAVGCVLLIACANIANLLLARAASREREIAVRAALGAGRGRVVRQLLTESVLLALAGGVLGLFLAAAGIALLKAAAPADLPQLAAVGIDGRVLAFTLALALATGLAFGLAPALELARPRLAGSLATRGGTGGRRGRAVRRGLVVAEVALALMLLIGAGLLVESFARLRAVDPGFEARRVLTVSLALSGPEYVEDRQVNAFFDRLMPSVRVLPGVEAAGVTTSVLLPLLASSGYVAIEGHPDPPLSERIEVVYDTATPDLFRALGTPLLAGRDLSPADGPEAPAVALINQAMAQHFWPGEDPVGKRFTIGRASPGNPQRTVVGVVGDARRTALEQAARPSLYLPMSQYAEREMTIVVRTAGDPLALGRDVVRAVWAIDRNQPITAVSTLEAELGGRLSRRRFNASLLGLFSGLALLLAALGIYGVVSHAVAQGRREIGIRIALGARAGEVVGGVLAQGLGLVAAGLGLGLAGALALRRILAGLLYGISATDPLTYGAFALVLAAAAALASYLPARRAARTDPMIVLRQE